MTIQTGKAEHRAESIERVKKILLTMPDYVNGFYYYMASSGRTSSYKTHEAYISYIKSFLNTIDKDIKDITMDDVMMYLASKKYKEDGSETSGSYMVAVYSALKKFFKYLVYSKRIDVDPMENVERPKPKAANLVERTYLEPNEIQNCFRYIKTKGGIWEKRNKAMFVIWFSTGIRNTCLTEINVGNVDFENNCIYVVDKGTKPMTCYLDDDKMNVIAEWIEDRNTILNGQNKTDALFINKFKERITPEGTSWVIKNITDHIGHKISPHKARASFITNAYNAGISIDIVSKLANHSSTKVTSDCYIQGQDEKIKEARIKASSYLSF